MKKIELTLLVTLVLFVSNNPLFAQESTMCTHIDDTSEDGLCITYGVPDCASTDVPDLCVNSGCGEVTITTQCNGELPMYTPVPDCCDAG
jgi:hypothetical protein